MFTDNWLGDGFMTRRIIPACHPIRTNSGGPCRFRLKSWRVETSADGTKWREAGRQEGNRKLNGKGFTDTFTVAGGAEYRFIRLVNISRNHIRGDQFVISAWGIIGSLIE
jgi:hypothetical protein